MRGGKGEWGRGKGEGVEVGRGRRGGEGGRGEGEGEGDQVDEPDARVLRQLGLQMPHHVLREEGGARPPVANGGRGEREAYAMPVGGKRNESGMETVSVPDHRKNEGLLRKPATNFK